MTKINLKLLPHQAEFVEDIETKFIALVGGFGSGKTEALIYKALALAGLNTGTRGVLLEPTNPLIAEILIPKMEVIMDSLKLPYTYKATPYKRYYVEFAGGTTEIMLLSAENYIRHIGFEVSFFGLDEFDTLKTEAAKTCFWKINERLRNRKNPSQRLQGFIATTYEGLKFVYNFFEKEPQDDPRLLKQRKLIRARTYDNPFLDTEYIKTLESLYPVKMVKMFLEGYAVSLTGGVYPEYGEENRMTEGFDPNLETFFAMDFGYNRPSILIGQMDGEKAYMIDEINIRDKYTEYQAMKMATWRDEHNIKYQMNVYCDPAGVGHQSSGSMTDIEILQAQGFNPVYTFNKHARNILSGVGQVATAFENTKGERHLFVNPDTCQNLDTSLMNYSYKKGNASVIDKDGISDHDCDALRYFVINRLTRKNWGFHDA